jgi:two-component system, sensor histidine kinase and response regulator
MDISNEKTASSILIVDDNPQNLQVLGRLLQEKQYDIEFATSGLAALDWLTSRQFDLVLLDINMPEMDGFEVCRRIRNDERYSKLPVVFLSADNDRESILKGFELGGQDYITKPFDGRELIVRVKTHISLKESLAKLEDINKSLEEKVRERTIQLSIANENLELMNRKLTELDDAKAEFLNLISHEIRTPLNGMILPVEMLKDTGSPTETGELIEILDSSVKRLEKFALNALLITRLKTRPYEIRSSDTDLNSVIESALEEAKDVIVSKGLVIRKKLVDNRVIITGDPELISKCVHSILDNAVSFTPAGRTVDISLRSENSLAVIEIADQGPGLPDEIIKLGAEPFARGKEYRDRSTGIGIPLSRLIMEAHRGEIVMANRKEGGAVVTLKFINLLN